LCNGFSNLVVIEKATTTRSENPLHNGWQLLPLPCTYKVSSLQKKPCSRVGSFSFAEHLLKQQKL
jgi:hypothetical protein